MVDKYRLQALDVETGQLVWEHLLSQKGLVLDSLLAKDEHLYVGIDKEIRTYQLLDGKLLWQVLGQPTDRTVYELVWLDNKLVNYSTVWREDYTLMSVYDPDTGVLLQQQQIPNEPRLLLTTTTTEYKGDCGGLFAFDRQTGKMKWQTRLNGCPQGDPTVIGSKLLIATYKDYGSIAGLHLINTADGDIIWSALKDNLISNFAIIDNIVYTIRQNGDIVGLNLGTGQEIGSINFSTNEADSSENLYWLTATDRKLFAYYGDSRELVVFLH